MGTPTLRFIEANGIRMRIAEMGSGPLVILVHGWPESWYSWRHQLPAIAEAGYHVVAPDMRGYGETDKPAAVEDYDIHQLTADVVGIVDALGEQTAVLVGHDWGAIVAWHCMLLHANRFTALVAMSVPYSGRGPRSLIDALETAYGDAFFYILYFQEPGVAEAGVRRRPARHPQPPLSLARVTPGSTHRQGSQACGGRMDPSAWVRPRACRTGSRQRSSTSMSMRSRHPGFGAASTGTATSRATGRRRRNSRPHGCSNRCCSSPDRRTWSSASASAEKLTALMAPSVPNLRGVTVLPGIGHWVQQESPAECNAAVVGFLRGLSTS